jgi:hypothetical protein
LAFCYFPLSGGTLLPSGKSFEILEKQYKKMIKQVLSLPMNIADPAIYIISGLLPAEAEIHKRAIILYGCQMVKVFLVYKT